MTEQKPKTKLPDYKDVKGLLKFIDDRGKIVASSRSGLSTKMQRYIARQIKRARHLALIPYTQTLK